jgi:hypothetical protein
MRELKLEGNGDADFVTNNMMARPRVMFGKVERRVEIAASEVRGGNGDSHAPGAVWEASCRNEDW